MSTALGDLVVSLGVDNAQFVSALGQSGASLDEFTAHTGQASSAVQEFEERGGEAGVSAIGASRSFGFLGKEIKEAGEGLGGTNSALGETVTGLGSTVSGLGEAVHGFHALHSAIGVVTSAQLFLNSISPIGWAAMAVGAVAATVAYFHFHDAATAAADAAKKLAEHNKEVAKETSDAVEEMSKAAAAAKKESDSIDNLLGRKQLEMSMAGMSEGQKYAATFSYEHPGESSAQGDQARQLGERMDREKALSLIQHETMQEQERDAKHLESTVRSLTEGPIDRMIAQAREIRAAMASGTLGVGVGETALAALKEKATPEEKQAKEEMPRAIEFGTAAAFEDMWKSQHPDIEPAQQTAANTAKMALLLETIAGHAGNGVQVHLR